MMPLTWESCLLLGSGGTAMSRGVGAWGSPIVWGTVRQRSERHSEGVRRSFIAPRAAEAGPGILLCFVALITEPSNTLLTLTAESGL